MRSVWKAFVTLAVAGSALLATEAASAQQMPSPDQIRQRFRQELSNLPKQTVENEHLTIVYTQLPFDMVEFAKGVAGGQVPPGVDPNQIARQVMPYARPEIDDFVKDFGTLTPSSDVKLKSKKLEAGQTYTFGLVMSSGQPAGILISGGDLKKPLKVGLKRQKSSQTFDPLAIEVVPDKRSDKKLSIQVGYGQTLGLAGTFKVL